MIPLPVVVGFGGVNAAGRISSHHAYRRTVIGELGEADAALTYRDLATMMKLDGDPSDPSVRAYIRDHTLIREIELFDTKRVGSHQEVTISALDGSDLTFVLGARQLPVTIPEGWDLKPLDRGRFEVRLQAGTKSKFFLPDYGPTSVSAAGQLPTGFNPTSTYPSRSHPRGLELAVIGASDAVQSIGLDWKEILNRVGPDGLAVFAGSAMGQTDLQGIAGTLQAPWVGKRPTSKQIAFSLSEMAADFVNAYVVGNLGATTGGIGACATFLYNARLAMEEIRSGRRRIAIAGGVEAPIIPELMEGYRTMGAVPDDTQLAALDNSAEPNLLRACRPFSDNAGFTIAEGGVYIVLMDDQLALELGANIYGSVGGIYVNADGIKKSISGPGVGNYLTVGKALALARSIIGEEGVRHRSFVHAHGTGTPQNRVTESHILNEWAKTFGIDAWRVAAVKAYLGHTMAAASGDQITSALGTWRYGYIPGIATIDHIADDVYCSNLDIDPKHMQISPESLDAAIVNSKGFGGNNATGVVLSPFVTQGLLRERHSKSALTNWQKRNEEVHASANEYDRTCTESGMSPIYHFGEGVLTGDDLLLSDQKIGVSGYKLPVSLDIKNPYLPDAEE